MYRDNKHLVWDRHYRHSFVLNHGALGDAICCLPAIAYGRQQRPPQVKMSVWCAAHQIELFKHLLAPYGEFDFHDIKTFPGKAADRKAQNFGPFSHNAPLHDTHTRNATHMVDFGFRFLLDKDPPSMADRSYTTKAPLGPRTISEPYIVIPTGYTSENKAFRASVMGPIIAWALERGYRPVLAGTKKSYTGVKREGKVIPLVISTEVDQLPNSLLWECKDMREKTTLLEARDLCGHAAAVVGVDGGTIHLAGTTDVPIVYALTNAHPKHRYIPRHGDMHFNIRYVGPRDLECANCQTNWTLTYHDFSKCAYEDNLCTYRLHPDDFIAGLQQLGL
jgi:glycosyl transferase family 9 (putative heptosyltransferase)